MKRSILLVLLLCVCAIPTYAQIDPNTLTWTTCGACPNPAEVSISGATIAVGVAGRSEDAGQNMAKHVASALLPPAASYTITFRYDLSSWDSYVAPGTPNPPFNGGTGYWDSFSVSISSQPYWQLTLSDPLITPELPGLGFLWGATSYGDHHIKQNSGTTTITIKGNANGPNYLNVGLDTGTPPNADAAFPSWGAFAILSIKTPCEADISNILNIPSYYQCGNANYNPYFHMPAECSPGAWWAATYDGSGPTRCNEYSLEGTTICDVGCTLSAYAMVLSHYGFSYDPGSLNEALKHLGGSGYDSSGGVLLWSVSSLTKNALEYQPHRPDADLLDSELCSGRPVILKVRRLSQSGKLQDHYVLAIGKTSGMYNIIDPGSIGVHTLATYNSTFYSMGLFAPPGSGAFVIYADSPVQVLVTDSVGRRAGYSAGEIVSEIPGAYYGDEEIGEDDPSTSIDHSLPLTHILSIPSPSEGFYQIQITGIASAPASIRILRYNKQNLPQTVQTINTNLAAGQTMAQTTTYSSRTGDINGDGFIDSSDLAIIKASFGKKIGQPGYNAAADVNGDGIVDVRDLAIVGRFDPPNQPIVPPPTRP